MHVQHLISLSLSPLSSSLVPTSFLSFSDLTALVGGRIRGRGKREGISAAAASPRARPVKNQHNLSAKFAPPLDPSDQLVRRRLSHEAPPHTTPLSSQAQERRQRERGIKICLVYSRTLVKRNPPSFFVPPLHEVKCVVVRRREVRILTRHERSKKKEEEEEKHHLWE